MLLCYLINNVEHLEPFYYLYIFSFATKWNCTEPIPSSLLSIQFDIRPNLPRVLVDVQILVDRRIGGRDD